MPIDPSIVRRFANRVVGPHPDPSHSEQNQKHEYPGHRARVPAEPRACFLTSFWRWLRLRWRRPGGGSVGGIGLRLRQPAHGFGTPRKSEGMFCALPIERPSDAFERLKE